MKKTLTLIAVFILLISQPLCGQELGYWGNCIGYIFIMDHDSTIDSSKNLSLVKESLRPYTTSMRWFTRGSTNSELDYFQDRTGTNTAEFTSHLSSTLKHDLNRNDRAIIYILGHGSAVEGELCKINLWSYNDNSVDRQIDIFVVVSELYKVRNSFNAELDILVIWDACRDGAGNGYTIPEFPSENRFRQIFSADSSKKANLDGSVSRFAAAMNNAISDISKIPQSPMSMNMLLELINNHLDGQTACTNIQEGNELFDMDLLYSIKECPVVQFDLHKFKDYRSSLILTITDHEGKTYQIDDSTSQQGEDWAKWFDPVALPNFHLPEEGNYTISLTISNLTHFYDLFEEMQLSSKWRYFSFDGETALFRQEFNFRDGINRINFERADFADADMFWFRETMLWNGKPDTPKAGEIKNALVKSERDVAVPVWEFMEAWRSIDSPALYEALRKMEIAYEGIHAETLIKKWSRVVALRTEALGLYNNAQTAFEEFDELSIEAGKYLNGESIYLTRSERINLFSELNWSNEAERILDNLKSVFNDYSDLHNSRLPLEIVESISTTNTAIGKEKLLEIISAKVILKEEFDALQLQTLINQITFVQTSFDYYRQGEEFNTSSPLPADLERLLLTIAATDFVKSEHFEIYASILPDIPEESSEAVLMRSLCVLYNDNRLPSEPEISDDQIIELSRLESAPMIELLMKQYFWKRLYMLNENTILVKKILHKGAFPDDLYLGLIYSLTPEDYFRHRSLDSVIDRFSDRASDAEIWEFVIEYARKVK